MQALASVLLLLSTSALLVQAGTLPAAEETKAVNITNNGFSVQTGYEGYVAPVSRSVAEKPDKAKYDFLESITHLKNIAITARALLLPFAHKIFAGAKFLSFFLLWGVVATHAVCKFTSFCSFNMNLPNINKENIKARIENVARPYMSDENLDYTLKLARSAMDSYTSVKNFI